MLEKLQQGRSSAQLGLFLALLATFCYSLKPIIIKLIYQYDDISSEDVLAWRVIISLPVYIIVGVWVWFKPSKHSESVGDEDAANSISWVWKSIVLGALGFYLAALFDLIGLRYISSQLARLILFTYPTLVAILAWLIFRQPISRTVLIALIVSYVGVGLIFAYDFNNMGDNVFYGSVMMFLSVLAFSLYVLLSKSIIDEVGGASFTVVAMLSSGVCILLHFLIGPQALDSIAVEWPAFWLIAAMTMLTTVIPSFLIAEAIALVGPQKTAIAGTIGPALTSVFAVILLNEAFGAAQIAGIVLVVAAITYMQRGSGGASKDSIELPSNNPSDAAEKTEK